jgi:hypothetical protein
MFTDCHVHIGKSNWFHVDAGVHLLLKWADKTGIGRMMVTDMTALFYDMEEGNELARKAAAEAPDRILPYYTVSSARFGPQLLEQIERHVNDYGFRGLKIYSVPPLYVMTDDYMLPVLEKAAELRIPVLAHCGAAECAWACERVPELMLINAHMGCCPEGGGDWHASVAAARKYPNMYLDTASSSFDNGMIEFAAGQLGAERVLLGTDMPVLNPVLQAAKVQKSDLSEEQKEMILGKNTERLLSMREKI